MAQAQRKKPQASGGGSNMKPFYILLLVIAAAGIGWIAYSAMGGGSMATQSIDLTALETSELQAQAIPIEKGNANAPVQVTVFSDFTCPACQVFTTVVEPQLRSRYVDAGLVRVVYYDYPLEGPGHPHSFIAARAARCANEQGRFWEYHDRLFARQQSWSFERSSPVTSLVQYASDLGMDASAFEQCLQSDRFADVVSANKALGLRLGLGGTPTVFIGTQQTAAWNNWEAFEADLKPQLPAQDIAADTAG